MPVATKIIRRRIKSITSTQQITKAMQMVAASKMRRAQEQALNTRPYVENLHQVLTDLAEVFYRSTGTEIPHPLLEKRPVKKILYIAISPDKGLCGGLTTNLIRFFLEQVTTEARPFVLVTLGKKMRDFCLRSQQEIIADFVKISDTPEFLDILPVSQIVINDYQYQKVDEVRLIYTHFLSTLSQRPLIKKILPIERSDIFEYEKQFSQKVTFEELSQSDIIYEPNAKAIFDHIINHFVEMQVYQAVLEAKASEHSARMVAMKNATENAQDIINDLTLSYNQARQASITQEVAEISAGTL